MLRLLLDTCTFLWLTGDVGKLSRRARAAIEDTGNMVFLSSASIFEIGILNAYKPFNKKYPIPKLVTEAAPIYELVHLNVTVDAVARLGRLPSIHNDPFDRLLICQANYHKLTLVTPDKKIHCYPVNYLW